MPPAVPEDPPVRDPHGADTVRGVPRPAQPDGNAPGARGGGGAWRYASGAGLSSVGRCLPRPSGASSIAYSIAPPPTSVTVIVPPRPWSIGCIAGLSPATSAVK